MNILTREGIPVSRLPAGGISSTQTPDTNGNAKPDSGSNFPIKQFLHDILQEGIPFVDGIAPKTGTQSTWKAKSSPTTFSQSEAPVYSSEKTVSVKGSDDGNGKERTEIWYSRRSCHRNAAEDRTASWTEFTKAFYSHHAETEYQYVPTVIGVRRALHWDTTGLEFDVNGEKWTDIICELWEMKHRIDPKPLQNRVFPTLQIAARLEGTDETIFLQTPVSGFAASPYSEFAKDKSLVVASYTAVERLRVLPEGGEIDWIMATASDAGGVLPQFVQNLAVPGEVPKDVKMFLEWIPSQRS